MRNKDKKIGVVLLIIFSVLVLSTIPLYREAKHNAWPQGEEAYYHMRIAEHINENGYTIVDPGVSLTTEIKKNPFDWTVSKNASLMGTKTTASILPFILGCLTIFLIFETVKVFNPYVKENLLVTIFIASSPIFIIIFSTLSEKAWIATIMAIGVWALTRKSRARWIAFIIFPLLMFHNVWHTIIALVLILTIENKQRIEKVLLSALMGIILIVSLMIQRTEILIRIPPVLKVIEQSFSDLGGEFGMSIFLVILGVIGTRYFWQERNKMWRYVLLGVFFVASAIYIGSEHMIYATVIIAICAAKGFLELADREWKVAYLKNITLFLLILGLLFSATSTISRTAKGLPNHEVIQGLEWVEKNTYENAIVVTAKEYAFITEYITQRRVLFDNNAIMNQANQNAWKEVRLLAQSRDMQEVINTFEKYQIDYIIIFEEMRHGLTWEREDQGLLFLLDRGENFKKVFENNEVTIWSIEYE